MSPPAFWNMHNCNYWLFVFRWSVSFKQNKHSSSLSLQFEETSLTSQRFHPERPWRTCLEDLIANGETGSVRLVVGHELDEQLAAAGDDRRRCDLPAELPQHGRKLVAAVVNLHEVVPAGDERRRRFRIKQVSSVLTLHEPLMFHRQLLNICTEKSLCLSLIQLSKALLKALLKRNPFFYDKWWWKFWQECQFSTDVRQKV